MQVLVTQIGKLGTILQAKKEETYGGASTFTVNTLFGKRDEVRRCCWFFMQLQSICQILRQSCAGGLRIVECLLCSACLVAGADTAVWHGHRGLEYCCLRSSIPEIRSLG